MECKVCEQETEVNFNINSELTPICEDCATAIFLQQAKFYAYGKSIFDLPQTVRKQTPKHPEIAAEVLNYLNEKLGKSKRYTVDTVPDVFLQHISARVEEGHGLRKLKAVVHHKYNEWNNDPYMKKFLRPATLFNRQKFNSYVIEVPEDYNPDNTREQREIIRQLSHFGMRGIVNEETDTLAKKLQATGYSNKKLLNTYLIKKT